MIHIIGVAHRAQVRKPGSELNADQQQVSTCVSRLIEQVKPSLIAEEQSSEGLGENQSVPKRIADRAGVEHRFCDPDSKRRAAMGYRNRQDIGLAIFQSNEGWSLSPDEITAKAGAIEIAFYFPVRERFWLDQLADRLHTEVVFVCGDGHVESFVRLLHEKGISSRIVDRAIGVNEEDTYTLDSALNYLQEHPELCSGAVNSMGRLITYEEISVHAYYHWEGRGRPLGSPQVDWYWAIEDLKHS